MIILQISGIIFSIVFIDLIMSLDTAIAINSALTQFQGGQKRFGLFVGGSIAILLRVLIMVTLLPLLSLPFIHVILGIVILIVSIQIIRDMYQAEEALEQEVQSRNARRKNQRSRSWLLAGTVAIAYLGSTFDNSIAVVAVTKNYYFLSISLIISGYVIFLGSSYINRLINRFPILLYGIGGTLSWIAASEVLDDRGINPFILQLDSQVPGPLLFYLQVITTLIFALGSYWWWNQHRQHEAEMVPVTKKRN